MKNRKMWIIASGASIAIVITAILLAIASERRYESEPIPDVVMAYRGAEYNGSLEGYNWQGSAPGPHTEFPHRGTLVNVTKGDTIEFAAVNASRQPDYYLVSVWDTTGSGEYNQVLEKYRLDRNRLLVDWDEGRTYQIGVAAIWVRIDLSGQHDDSVSYSHHIYVTK